MHKLDNRPKGIDGTNLEELYNEANLAAWPPQKRSNYERIMGHQYDFEISLQDQKEEALERGRAEGREEGIVEGREEKARETAQKMLAKGMSIHDIADLTGLSTEEIQAL